MLALMSATASMRQLRARDSAMNCRRCHDAMLEAFSMLRYAYAADAATLPARFATLLRADMLL